MPLPEGVTTIAVSKDFRAILGVAARVRGMTMQKYVDIHLQRIIREDMRAAVAEVANAASPEMINNLMGGQRR
jgi:hypothetical protein